MINICPQTDSLLWCCQALAHKVSQGQAPSLSQENIKGGSGQSLFDLLLYKRDFRNYLLTWAQQTFKDEEGALSWIQDVVVPKVHSFTTWSRVEVQRSQLAGGTEQCHDQLAQLPQGIHLRYRL